MRILPVLFVVLCLATLVGAQDTDVIRIESALVSVPVIVTDSQGRYITDLTAKDFGILNDGARRPVEFFGTTEEPLTVAILIDTSHSTRPVLGDIKDAARAFLKLLTPRDRAMIVTFDHDVNVLCPLTSDQGELSKAVKKADIPDPIGTVLRDAVYQTVFTSFAGINGRKAIILLTDGQDGSSHTSQQTLLSKLEETDTLVYGIQFRTEDRRVAEYALRNGHFPREKVGASQRQSNEERKSAGAGEFMDRMARATAARFFSTDAGKLKGTFETILDELRRQYRLGFYPPDNTPNDDHIHDVRVMVMRPGLIVRARAGYRLGTRPPETH